jgi:hypothetical protein
MSSFLARPTGGALVAFALSLVLYGLLLQPVPYGDGVLLLYALEQRVASYHHISYLLSTRAFMDAAGWLGFDELRAAFAFSAFMAALGNAFLYLLVAERCRSALVRIATVALVATAPSILFFGTTIENPANHYGSVCLALWAVAKLVAQRHWVVRWLACLPALLVPLSHASGPMLLGCLLLLVITREGREPLFRGWWGPRGERKLGRAMFFLLPSILLWWFDKPVRIALFGTDKVDQIEPGTGQLAMIFERGVDPSQLLPFVYHEWFLTAFGVWSLWLLAMLVLWLRERTSAWIALGAVGPYLLLFTLYQTWERGAYFLPILPVAAWSLARAGARIQPKRILQALLALIAAALVAGQLYFGQQRIQAHLDLPAAPWTWANDVQTATQAATQGSKSRAHILCADLFRGMHLIVDHDIDGILLKPWIGIWREAYTANPQPGTGPAAFAAQAIAHFHKLLETGPLYITDEMWNELPKLVEGLQEAMDKTFVRSPIEQGLFRAQRLEAR